MEVTKLKGLPPGIKTRWSLKPLSMGGAAIGYCNQYRSLFTAYLPKFDVAEYKVARYPDWPLNLESSQNPMETVFTAELWVGAL